MSNFEITVQHYNFISYYGFEVVGRISNRGLVQLRDANKKGKTTKATFYLNEGNNSVINDFRGGKYSFYTWSKENSLEPLKPIKLDKVPEQPTLYFEFNGIDKERSKLETLLIQFLPKYFHEHIKKTFRKYRVFEYNGRTAFPRIKGNKFNYFKSTPYNDKLKRDKSKGKFYWSSTKDFRTANDKTLFFGSHLINENNIVVIVESEKTALLLDIFYNDLNIVFVAVGGLTLLEKPLQAIRTQFPKIHIYTLPDKQAFQQWDKISLKYNTVSIPFADNYLSEKQDAGDVLENEVFNIANNPHFKTLGKYIQRISTKEKFDNEYSTVDYKIEPFEILEPRKLKSFNDELEFLQLPSYHKKVILSENHNIECETNEILIEKYFTIFDKNFTYYKGYFNVYKLKNYEDLINKTQILLTVSRILNESVNERDLLLRLGHEINQTNLFYVDLRAFIQDAEHLPSLDIKDVLKEKNYLAHSNAKELSGKQFIFKLNNLRAGVKEDLLKETFILPEFMLPIDIKQLDNVWSNTRKGKGKQIKDLINSYNVALFGVKKYDSILKLEDVRYYIRDHQNVSEVELMRLFEIGQTLIRKYKPIQDTETAKNNYNSLVKILQPP